MRWQMVIRLMVLLICLCGRTDEVKQQAMAEIFATLKDFTAQAMETHSIAISAEMRDIDADLSPKFGNVRDHMEGTQ